MAANKSITDEETRNSILDCPIMGYRSKGLSAFLILLLICGVYGNTLFNTFVYDDKDIIVKKSFIKYLKNIPALFTSDCLIRSGEMSYRPVVTFSYMLDYALWTRLKALRYDECMNYLRRSLIKGGGELRALFKSKKDLVNNNDTTYVLEQVKKHIPATPSKEFSAIILHRPIGFHLTNLILHFFDSFGRVVFGGAVDGM